MSEEESGDGGFRLVKEPGATFLEGPLNRPLMQRGDDATLIVEACLSGRVNSVLLYAENLTQGFFDLSSGEAGAILQKLRNYRIRLGVVCIAGVVRYSRRFGELVAEESGRDHFRVFESRQAAREWLSASRSDG